MKVYDPAALAGAPAGFRSKEWRAKDLPGMAMTIQVSADDCTGRRICVETCPAKDKQLAGHKSLDSLAKPDHLERERENREFFLTLPEIDRALVQPGTVTGSQMLQPLFEFTGKENRFLLTARSNPDEAAELAASEQHDVEERWRLYERLSTRIT